MRYMRLLFPVALVASFQIDAAITNYVKLVTPSNTARASYVPAYLYEKSSTGMQQIGYIPYAGAISFLGDASSVLNSKNTYYLYHQDDKNWHYCQFNFDQGEVHSNCSAALTNPQTGSNEYVLSLGAVTWAITSNAPTPAPQAPNVNQPRTITFTNNTKYPVIAIASVSSDCQKFDGSLCEQHVLKQGESYTYGASVLSNQFGQPSQAYVVSGFSKMPDCQPGQSCWVKTGGYATGESKQYATKFEVSWLPVVQKDPNNPVNLFQSTNVDMSAVDGFNFAAVMYPTTPAYCTSGWAGATDTDQPENVSYFSKENPIAILIGKRYARVNSTGLACSAYSDAEQACQSISVNPLIPANDPEQNKVRTINLALYDNSGQQFIGCQSPRTWASANKETAEKIFGSGASDKFACSGDYSAYPACTKAGFQNNAYVNASHALFKNVYGYPYDDLTKDFACPAMASYVVDIFSDGGLTPCK